MRAWVLGMGAWVCGYRGGGGGLAYVCVVCNVRVCVDCACVKGRGEGQILLKARHHLCHHLHESELVKL